MPEQLNGTLMPQACHVLGGNSTNKTDGGFTGSMALGEAWLLVNHTDKHFDWTVRFSWNPCPKKREHDALTDCDPDCQSN